MAKTALVLAGGAARGAYELGVWRGLRQLGIPIHVVTGTSIGAVNGALIAQEDFESAQQFWRTLEFNKLFKLRSHGDEPRPKRIRSSYLQLSKNFITEGGSDVRLLLGSLKPYLNEEKIRRSPIEFGLVTVSVDEKKVCEYFREDIPAGRMLDYIFASCSVGPAFKPYVIDGKRYVDGCYYDNLPVSMAIAKGADHVIAVDLDAFGIVRKKDLRAARSLTLIRSHWDLGPSFFFDGAQFQRNDRLGYLDALKAFHHYDGQAYAFTAGTAEAFMKEFLSENRKLPFMEWSGSRFLFLKDRRASRRLLHHLQKRLINKTDIRHLLLAWAESAGEIFELDPLRAYSLEEFNQLLLQGFEEASDLELPGYAELPGLPGIKSALSGAGISGFGALRLQLSLYKASIKDMFKKEVPHKINRGSTVKYLVGAFREHAHEDRLPMLSNLAALMPSEVLGALYILWLQDYREKPV